MENANFDEVSARTKEQFKVHYHLRGGSHEMDALVRNRCEAEIISLMREVSRLLEIPFRLEVVPPVTGGWEEHILLIGEHREQITFIRDIVVSIFTIGGGALSAALYVKHNLKHAKQQTTLTDLTIEKARLEVKKMQREDEAAHKEKSGDLELEPHLTTDQIASALLGKKKVQLKRSNLYRNLASYNHVEAVGYSNAHQRLSAERIIDRQNFEQFIVQSEEIEPLMYKRIEIEIVSPVLRAGNQNWRGIFERKNISFDLSDSEFRRQVVDQEVVFQNGTKLVCDLEIQMRENEVGEPEVIRRVVDKVHAVRQVTKANPDVQAKLDLRDRPSDSPTTRDWGD